jgi:homoaconitate hydratase
MPQTLIEKIVQRHAVGVEKNYEIHSGDYITIKPAYVMTHDNTGAVIPKFISIGAKKFANPKQVVFTLDHNIQDKSEKNLEKYKKIESFAQKMRNDFFPAGRGIGHQIMIEEGYAYPGKMVVASDSHSNIYGGIACLGTPIVRTDAAAIWATGTTWWQVPSIVKVILNGKLRPGVSGKDLIISLCGFFNNDEVLNHAIEFTGNGVESLTIDERLTISNMTTEWGALAGVFPVDNITIEWLKERAAKLNHKTSSQFVYDKEKNFVHPRLNLRRIAKLEQHACKADEEAFYAKEIVVDLNSIQPFVSGPNNVKTMMQVSSAKAKNIKIDKAYLVSCVNSRVSDIAEAANIMRGKKVAKGVKFYIAAASSEVQNESENRGDWQTLIQAGAIPLPPGCGPCIGLGTGLLEDGEVGISATNRNFKGRMGSPNAQVYLASPSVVAASAIAGKIDYPWEYSPANINAKIKSFKMKDEIQVKTKIINGFLETMEGNIIFCFQNNLNTDGIFPGKYTYNDDFTPEQQAKVVMENYDPEFGKIAKSGDILVGGFNFGTGSSREQAATALKFKGIKLLIAGSFNETYKRNALNNGLPIIECSELFNDLKEQFGNNKPTVNTGLHAVINFSNSEITINKKNYSFSPFGEAAQKLIVAGGLEGFVKNSI